MDATSETDPLLKLLDSPLIPEHMKNEMKEFLVSYARAARANGHSLDIVLDRFTLFFKLVAEQMATPYQFQSFHTALRSPFDYYRFGLDFVRPLLDISHSTVRGKEELEKIQEAMQKKENAILFSNHQTEIDPQIISLLIEKEYPSLAENMIFVAGHRVITDPLAIPFSLGRNLLCIYSKKYLDQPPEQKSEKIRHNQKTLKVMEELLREGGKCIYIAPSGGRDRLKEEKVIEVAPFDPQSIEMLHLIAQRAKTKTHFHTLALSTYALLPPPAVPHQTIGELRSTLFSPAHLHFSPEWSFDKPEGQIVDDKKQERKIRALAMWQQVKENHERFHNT